MSDQLLVSSRKGLFTIRRKAGRWEIDQVDFLGDNVSLALTDHRDGRHYAALDHGHFGVKLHRSTASGWEEIAAPQYPPKPEGYEELDMWGRPVPGARCAYGRSRRPAATTRASFGAEPFPEACSAPPITGTAGR